MTHAHWTDDAFLLLFFLAVFLAALALGAVIADLWSNRHD